MHYMPLRGVLFDLDDTLFDHDYATLSALSVVRAEEPAFAAWSVDAFAGRHSEVLEAMHVEVLTGRRSIEASRAERFRRLLAEALDAEVANGRASELAQRYRAAYEAAWRPVPGAVPLLTALRAAGFPVAIVTNNLIAEQVQKLRHCALDVFVDALVTSEEVGVAKPEIGIFAAALDRLRLDATDVVMVGDAWGTDIAGAIGAGIRPIWFNRRAASSPNPSVVELNALEPTEHVVEVIRGVSDPRV